MNDRQANFLDKAEKILHALELPIGADALEFQKATCGSTDARRWLNHLNDVLMRAFQQKHVAKKSRLLFQKTARLLCAQGYDALLIEWESEVMTIFHQWRHPLFQATTPARNDMQRVHLQRTSRLTKQSVL